MDPSPGSVLSEEIVLGPNPPIILGSISPATIPSLEEVPGPKPLANPALLYPIRPATITSIESVPGPFIPDADVDPDAPLIPVGGTELPSGITVAGYPQRLDASATPELNGVGSGSFTTWPDGPEPDEIVSIKVAGRQVFQGRAAVITRQVVDSGEEARQTISTELDGLLKEMDRCLVLPDFGAGDPSLLGSPVQDERRLDWSVNRISPHGSDLLPALDLGLANVLVMRAAAELGAFPLPDVWPDPDARWMWVAPPFNVAPRGHCFFRCHSGPRTRAGKYQAWAVAHDQAEVSMDGVVILTCDTPGVAQRIDLDLTARNHLVTIDAYNDSGRAGVAFSLLPVNQTYGVYETPTLRSSAAWGTIAYPKRTLRYTPGAAMMQLRAEAVKRRVFGVWDFSFDQYHDSAGRPWPPGEVITLKVGDTMLDVLDQLAEDRVDYAAAPGGRTLHMWVKGLGTGRDVPVPWVTGQTRTGQTQTRSTR